MENATSAGSTGSRKFVWNGIDLESLRQIMDKPADDAVQSIYDTKAPQIMGKLLREMAANDSAMPHFIPDAMSNFMKSELAITFTDEEIANFKMAHDIWERKGMNFIFILFFRALPYTYMAEKPANVLTTTALLSKEPSRRIIETAQFVFDVMDNNWWEPDKRGILTALKIRVMHASMRHVILDNNVEPVWNPEWGKPISQEDLIATNQVFSLEFFKGLTYLDIDMSAEEQNAWYQTWRVIGRIMGVEDRLLCPTVEEAWGLQKEVYAHLFKDETKAGIPLAKALVDTLTHFHMDTKLSLLMMRRMLEDDQFPDCFHRMLGPTYEAEYPELFARYHTPEENAKHHLKMNTHIHEQLKDYHDKLQDVKKDMDKRARSRNIFIRFIEWLFGIKQENKVMLEIHLAKIHDILYDDAEKLVDKLEEDMIKEAMCTMGGVMVSVLSTFFRRGKQSGFRIPKDLQAVWSKTNRRNARRP